MKRKSIAAALAIGVMLSPSALVSSFPPDIRITFEGWSSDSNKCVLRKTVVDTGDSTIVEDALYIVNLSSSMIEVDKKKEFTPQKLEGLFLVKTGPVSSSDEGVRTFVIGANRYVYVGYDTVIENIEDNVPSYTIHRRIWTLDNGITRMIFKEDESFSKVSTRREHAVEAYLSPDSTKLMVLFDVSSHFEQKGFVVVDLAHWRMVENKMHVLD
jgi:hypothetical protein